jgi:hypothetical protein
MIARASGLGLGAGRLARPRRGVGVITSPHVGLDTTQRVEVLPDAGVLRLLVPSVAVGVFVDRHCEADGVEITH